MKADGSVVTWGNEAYGGNSVNVAHQLGYGVTEIHHTDSAFVALKLGGLDSVPPLKRVERAIFEPATLPLPPVGELELKPTEVPSMWVVVGGIGRGGILVRQGDALNSPQLPLRLATGAKVRQLKLTSAGRLHYERLEGDGPDTGWVSVSSGGKELVRRTVH